MDQFFKEGDILIHRFTSFNPTLSFPLIIDSTCMFRRVIRIIQGREDRIEVSASYYLEEFLDRLSRRSNSLFVSGNLNNLKYSYRDMILYRKIFFRGVNYDPSRGYTPIQR